MGIELSHKEHHEAKPVVIWKSNHCALHLSEKLRNGNWLKHVTLFLLIFTAGRLNFASSYFDRELSYPEHRLAFVHSVG